MIFLAYDAFVYGAIIISAKIRVYTYLYLGGTLFVNWYRK